MSFVLNVRGRAKKVRVLRQARAITQLVGSYAYDARRFVRFSGIVKSSKLEVLESHIVMDFHRVEKGLTLPEPRPWFGRETVERLLANCVRYAALDGHDKAILAGALGALREYKHKFQSSPNEWWSAIEPDFEKLASSTPEFENSVGGTEPLLLSGNKLDEWNFSKFARSRSSIRNFSERSVDLGVIQSAIADAQTTPSVCNRQAARVRIFAQGEFANKVLQTQNGNRGFGHTASHVLVVTSDLSAFLTPGERNQGYIDGGMFAMSLIYGLHGAGVGSCPLNWSTVKSQDLRLRKLIGLPDEEIVIMMIAIGYPSDDAVVTASPLRNFDRVLLSHGQVQTKSPGSA